MLELINSLWPMFIGFITLVVVLSQMYMRIQVLEEKVKTLFDLLGSPNILFFWSITPPVFRHIPYAFHSFGYID